MTAILIDIEKMFDSVSWEILFKHLDRIKFPKQISGLIRNLYENIDVRFITNKGLEKLIIETESYREVLMDLCWPLYFTK